MSDSDFDPDYDLTRYGIWDRRLEEWAVRDQCESRVDDLLDTLYDSYRYEKREYWTGKRV